MDNASESDLWEKIDSLRNELKEQWEAVDRAYNDMTDQTGDTLKAEKAGLYHEAIEKANHLEQDICDLLDRFENT